MDARLPRCCVAAFLLLSLKVWGQPAPGAASAGPGTGCDQSPKFYEDHRYTVRRVKIKDPFNFVRFVRLELARTAQSASDMEGHPLSLAAAKDFREQLEDQAFSDDFVERRVRAALVTETLEECTADTVTLVYRVYTTQVAPSFSSLFESRQRERTHPQQVAGAHDPQQQFTLVPALGYDRSQQFYGGGKLAARLAGGNAPFQRLQLEGRGSSSTTAGSATLTGAHDWEDGWMRHAEWAFDYSYSSLPTDQAHLNNSRALAQFAMESRPLALSARLRLGGSFEKGNQQTRFPVAELSADTLASAGYASAKVYVGTTFRTKHHAFTSSCGLETGFTDSGGQVDYLKHIGDVGYDVWWPVGDHRSLEIENRFTVGGIQVPGLIPAAARFYGGNAYQLFIPGDTWQIRSTPFLRSFPSNRLVRVDGVVGATQFFSYNATVALAVWRMPLVPREVTGDAEFQEQLDGALQTAESTLTVELLGRDIHVRRVVSTLSQVSTHTAALEAEFNRVKGEVPSALGPQVAACERSLKTLQRRLRSAIDADAAQAYANLPDLLDPDGVLDKALAACVDRLNEHIGNPVIAQNGSDLQRLQREMRREMGQVEEPAATRKAKAELQPVRRTLDTLFNDVNIYSVSPVAIFDVVRFGTAGDSLMKYAAGGGLRLSLVNSVNMTAGYAWSVNRSASDPVGALFFSLTFRDLFE